MNKKAINLNDFTHLKNKLDIINSSLSAIDALFLEHKDKKTKSDDFYFPQAYFDLAFNIYNNVEKNDNDVDKMIYYFQRACEFDYPRAYYALGIIFQDGIYVKQDEEKAFKFYEKGARLLDMDAYFEYAKCFLFGNGVPMDIYKGLYLLNETSFIKEYKNACNLVGDYYLCYKDPSIDNIAKALSTYYFFTEDSKDKNIRNKSLFLFYTCEDTNKLTFDDLKEDIDVYSEDLWDILDNLDEKSDPIVSFVFGFICLKQENNDYGLLEESEKGGFSKASLYLGHCYLNGLYNFKKDIKLGLDHLTKGLKDNDLTCIIELASYYLNNDDTKKADEYLSLIDDKNIFTFDYYFNFRGRLSLRALSKTGLDLNIIFSHLSKKAKEDEHFAIIGGMLSYFLCNFKQAVDYFNQAQNYAVSFYFLSLIYFYGLLNKHNPDYKSAKDYALKAIDGGYERALDLLKEIKYFEKLNEYHCK